MKWIRIFIVIFFIGLVSSCGSSRKSTVAYSNKSSRSDEKPRNTKSDKKARKPLSEKEKRQQKIYADADIYFQKFKKNNQNINQFTVDYIGKYKNIAIEKMVEHKIPASITLAQGILESGNGLSELTSKANNHFGIKCHNGWKGKKVYHDDDKRNECFRKYPNAEGSFEDHSIFLTSRSRYASLFDLRPDDYKGWAKGLKKAGYATDRKYPHKLISFIENFDLYEYDDIVLKQKGKKSRKNPKVYVKETSINYILVSKGDTLYSIARNNNLTVARLKELNGLYSNEIAIGQKLFLSK